VIIVQKEKEADNWPKVPGSYLPISLPVPMARQKREFG